MTWKVFTGARLFQGIGARLFQGIGARLFQGIGARLFQGIGALLSQGIAALLLQVPLAAQPPQAVYEKAVADFGAGRVAESAAGFDTLATLVPSRAPQLWQRGIALYYAGRYRDCRAQFESHRTVNPNDVENAAWHFLCVARDESADTAKAAILPVGPDARVPMRQVYEMFRGALSPEMVLKAAGARDSAQFYAQLYVGLYYEALGDSRRALEHITAAAADRYADPGGYMHTVAKVHLGILRNGARPFRQNTAAAII